jgi:acetolactate synthase-1/2/3 large subunit
MTPAPQWNASERIAEWLVSVGVEQVFGVTGGGAMFLNQALGVHPGLKCTFMHHEQACAMAAEGYARISGKPAVVMLTTGPGSINALNGVYGAFTDSIPMIVISGQIKRETCLSFHDLPGLRQLGDQEGPIIAMASPICKYSRLVRDVADLCDMLPEAFSHATMGRPGPVWLDIPLDIQQSKEPVFIPSPRGETRQQNPLLRSQCEEILSRLRSADRPVVLGGTGVRLAGVNDRLLALLEKYGIPLATAWTHDIIATDHPLFAGRPGTIGTRSGNFILQSSDFVLVLGSRLNIRQVSYNWNSFAKGAWLAQVDVDGAELSKPTRRPDLGVKADLRDFLDVFERLLSIQPMPDFSPWVKWCGSTIKRFSAEAGHVQNPNGPINPYVLVDKIFSNLRSDDIVVCGNASACIIPFQVGLLKADQRLFSNSGSASMGYDLPAAIGAAEATLISHGKRRVICFAGDGSLQMNIQELQTLKTRGLNVVIIVLNNAGYLSIWQTHENFFGKVVGATPASGVEFPDFQKLAEAFGVRSVSISNVKQLSEIDDLLARDGPLLIDVHVDPRQEFTPRIKSRVDTDGRFVTPDLDDMYPFLSEDTRDAIRAEAKVIKAV